MKLNCSSTKSDLPSLLFIHGNSHSKKVFHKQIQSSLLKCHFNLIAVDLPGHGESPCLDPNQYSLIDMGKILSDFVSQLDCQKLILVGHSLGGHLAFEIAANLSTNIIKGVCVFGTPPFGNLDDLAQAFTDNSNVAYLFKASLTDKEIEAVARTCYRAGNQKDYLLSTELIRKAEPLFRESIMKQVQLGHFQDEIKIMNNLGNKVALIHACEDALVRRDYFDRLDLSNVWKGKLIEIADSGHSPHLEQSDVFNQLLYEFACEKFQ